MAVSQVTEKKNPYQIIILLRNRHTLLNFKDMFRIQVKVISRQRGGT